MKPIFLILLVAALFGTGCDHLNWQQYQIAGVSPGSPDATKLKTILQNVATQTGLSDKTDTSEVPGTLVLYTQPPRHFRLDLGARFYQTNVLVDLVAGIGPTPDAYKQAERLLTPALSAEFGSRLSAPNPPIPTHPIK